MYFWIKLKIFEESEEVKNNLGTSPRNFLVAGAGFEPHDLRVMSPTSYQAALPRDIFQLHFQSALLLYINYTHLSSVLFKKNI